MKEFFQQQHRSVPGPGFLVAGHNRGRQGEKKQGNFLFEKRMEGGEDTVSADPGSH